MRWFLLWCARNPWLAANVPKWRFAQRAVRRFLPGEDFDSAMQEARGFHEKGVGAIFTRLGENVTTLAEASAVVEHLEGVLSASADIGAEISVKPTQLGLDLDPAATYANLVRLVDAARRSNCFVWIDMEGSAYTSQTVELYARLRAEQSNIGIAVQAYLRQTVSDIARLLPLEPAIRLVKGAYAEPSQIAFQAKRDVDANYLAMCVFMLPSVKAGRLRLVLGTHDVELVDSVWRIAETMGLQKSQLEVAMLYGIRTDQLLRLASEGFAVKDLIAYGNSWYAWYLRRLAERPANLLFAARQLVG